MKVLLQELTREEIGERLKQLKVVILPVGSMEQHGLHLPLKYDSAAAAFIAERAAETLFPKVLVAPTVSVGLSAHHMRWSGTLTLQPDTFVNAVAEICDSLGKHGMKKVVILNGHGGNRKPSLFDGEIIAPIDLVAQRARKLGVKAVAVNYWDLIPPDPMKHIMGEVTGPGHAGDFETSMALYFCPQDVRRDRIIKCDGISEDLEKATAEKGRQLIEAIVEGLTLFITEFMEGKNDCTYHYPYGEYGVTIS